MTDQPRPPAIGELLPTKDILDEQQAGRAAYRAGQPVTTCPHAYGPDDETPEQAEQRKARRLMWVRGFTQAQHDEKRSLRSLTRLMHVAVCLEVPEGLQDPDERAGGAEFAGVDAVGH